MSYVYMLSDIPINGCHNSAIIGPEPALHCNHRFGSRPIMAHFMFTDIPTKGDVMGPEPTQF